MLKPLVSLMIAFVAATAFAVIPCNAQTTVTFASFGGITQEVEVQGLFADAGKLGIELATSGAASGRASRPI